jgi:DNA segregation ATPase FtsK/SpoIIIE-like protein
MKYVYILKAGSDHYKVGITADVVKRLKSIQTGNAYKVYVVAVRLCKDASKVEKKLHERLAAMSTAGGTEWFELSPADVVRVCILLNLESQVDIYGEAQLSSMAAEQLELLKVININVLSMTNTSNMQVNLSNNIGIVSPTISREERDEVENNRLYQEAWKEVTIANKASTSMLQRRLRIGYGRASRIIDQLCEDNIIGAEDGARPRVVLNPHPDYKFVQGS